MREKDDHDKLRTFEIDDDETFFAPGHVIGGRYKVISVLGKGGMGTVYKALQVFLNHECAVKVLDRRRVSDDVQVRRFQLEAKAAHSLNHANLVRVQDFGLLDDGQPYLVMDLVEGVTLSDYIRDHGTMSVDQVKAMFTQVCSGLAYAHDQTVVHRDIKPSNIMIVKNAPLGSEGSVKILDFGIAKIASDEAGEIQQLTKTGEIFGSPLYMSPEQCTGDLVDHRSDIYSLGCVIFEALTGTPPYFGSSALRTMMMHQSEPAPLLREASLGREFPDAIEQMVKKMLQKSPHDRYQNLSLVINALKTADADGKVSPASVPKRSTTKKQSKSVSLSLPQIYGLLTAAGITGAIVTTWICYELAQHTPVSSVPKVAPNPPPPAESVPKGAQDYKHNAALDYLEQKKVSKWQLQPGQMKSSISVSAEGKAKVFHFPVYCIGSITNSLNAELSLGKVAYHSWIGKNDVAVPANIPLTLDLDYRFYPAPYKYAPILESINPADFAALTLRGNPVSEEDEEPQDMARVLKVATTWINLEAIALYSINENGEATNLISQMKKVRYMLLEGISIENSKSLKEDFWRQLTGVALLKAPSYKPRPDWAIKILATSKNLERMELDRTIISPSVLRKLSNCPNLKNFISRNSVSANGDIPGPIDDATLDILLKLPHLKRLSLQATTITPEQFKRITKCFGIKEVLINQCSVENLKASNCRDSRIKVLVE